MNPADAKNRKRTISMLSLKVHVDEDDYQKGAEDQLDDPGWSFNEQELLAGVESENGYLG